MDRPVSARCTGRNAFEEAMTAVLQESPPPPAWLVRLALGSIVLAMMAFGTLLWAKWGIVLAMGQDILKACF